MKHSGFTILNLIIIGVGILFIAASRRYEFFNSLVFFTGIAFIVPGVVSTFSLFLSKKKRNSEKDHDYAKSEQRHQSAWSRFVNWTVSIAAIILGAMMCFIPETFRTPLIYIFATFFLLGGLYHIYMLLRGLRPATFDRWLYILPTIIIAIACALLFIPTLRSNDSQSTVALLSGIAMILFGITSLFEGISIRAYNRRVAQINDNISDTPADRQLNN